MFKPAIEILEEKIFNNQGTITYLEIAFFLDDDIEIIPGYVNFIDYQNNKFEFIDFQCNSNWIYFDDLIESKELPYFNNKLA
ncbi:hypothetical protein AAGG74_15870 [Bacillus mexicanus]|uniref:hypothetical protein n=1 Tax=Bacillus mexicanus TaxID=2834415 RepID=UPI003D2251E8